MAGKAVLNIIGKIDLSSAVANLQSTLKKIPPFTLKTTGKDKMDTSAAGAMLASIQQQSGAIDKIVIKQSEFRNKVGESQRAVTSMVVTWKGGLESIIPVYANVEAGMKRVAGSQTKGTIDVGKAQAAVEKAYSKQITSIDALSKKGQDYAIRSQSWNKAEKEAFEAVNTKLQTQTEAYKKLTVAEAAGKKGLALAAEIKATGVEMDKLISSSKLGANALRDWGSRMGESIKNTITYAFSLGLLRQAQQLLADGIKYTIELNKEMVKIQVLQAKGAQTPAEIKALAMSFNELATQMGVTTLEIAQGSVEWLRQGKSIKDTTELLKASTTLSKLGNLSAADSTNYLTSTLNSYKLGTEDAIRVVDKLIAVDNKSATSTYELATALRYSAAAAAEAGVTLEQLVSYIGTVSSVTRQNAESIGQGMKTIFTRMQDIKSGALDEDSTGINNVETALKRVGIELRDSKTNFRDMGTVLQELAFGWEKLNEVEQSNIAKAIAGVRQRNMFVVLMQNMNMALDLQTEQFNSTSLAADRYQIYLQGVEAAQNKFTTAIQKLWQTGINSGLIKNLIDLGTGLITLISDFGGLTTALSIATVALLAFNSTLITAKFAAIAQGVSSLARGFALAAANGGIFAGVMTLINAMTPVGWLIAAIAAITALGGAIDYYSKAAERATQAFTESTTKLRDSANKLKAQRESEREGLKLAAEYEKLLAEGTDRSAASQERFVAVQKELGDLYSSLPGFYDKQNNFMITGKDIAGQIKAIEDAKLLVLKAENVELQKAFATNAANLLQSNKKKLGDIDAQIATGRAASKTGYKPGPTGGLVPFMEEGKILSPAEIEGLKTARQDVLKDNGILMEGMAAMVASGSELESVMLKDSLAIKLTDQEMKQVEDRRLEIREGINKTDAEAGKPTRNWQQDLTDLDKIKKEYLAVAEAVNTYGANSKEAQDAAQKAIGKGDLSDVLDEQGVSLEKLAGKSKEELATIADGWAKAKKEGVDYGSAVDAAMESGIGKVEEAISVYDVFGAKVSQPVFLDLAKQASTALWQVLEDADATSVVVRGVTLDSADAIYNFVAAYPDAISDLIDALKLKSAEGTAFVQAQWSNAASMISMFGGMPGFTAPKITAPTASTSGESAEKKRLDKEIKLLEDKKKALQDSVDEFKNYIDAQKESLKLLQEEKEFNDDLMKKNRSLAKLKTEIVVLALDDSEAARASRLQMEEEAATLEEEIAKDKEDRKYNLQIEALDKAQADFEDKIDRQMDLLDNQIDKYRDMQSEIQSTSKSVAGTTKETYTLAQATQQAGGIIANVYGTMYNLSQKNISALDTQIQKWIQMGYTIAQVEALARNAAASAAWGMSFNLGKEPLGMPNQSVFDRSLLGTLTSKHSGGLIESHHEGDFGGGLKSNEVFAKLLKGEYVATEGQMSNFMSNILPKMLSTPSTLRNTPAGDTSFNLDKMEINVAGSLDKTVLPDLKNVISSTVLELMERRGVKRNTNSFSI